MSTNALFLPRQVLFDAAQVEQVLGELWLLLLLELLLLEIEQLGFVSLLESAAVEQNERE
jgi:hypothetical protein